MPEEPHGRRKGAMSAFEPAIEFAAAVVVLVSA